jgi:phosphatidylglycerol:prolipoprotein diacylglycerol transferase
VHPVFIRLGPLDIHTYGVLVAAGFVAGLWLAARRAGRSGLKTEAVTDLGAWLIVAGILGAKLFHVIFFWGEFVAGWQAEGVRSLREGFVFYGGFIGACAATIFYARRRQLPLWKLADVLAPSVAIGHAFGRLGCFFNGCCFGKACALPWAVEFPPPHLMRGMPVHPTQLYEAAGNLAIYAGLSALYRRKRFDGQIWWLYVLCYGALRFAVEFFRGDYDAHWLGVFTLGHVIAAGMIALAAAMLFGSTRRA